MPTEAGPPPSSFRKRFRGPSRIAATLLSFGILFGLVLGLSEVHEQQYIPQHFFRNAAIVIRNSVNRVALVSSAVIVTAFVLGWLIGRQRRMRVSRPILLGLAMASIGAVLLRHGWTMNRYGFASAWRTTTDLWGLRIPGGFASGKVLLANLEVAAVGLASVALLYKTGVLAARKRFPASLSVPVARAGRFLVGGVALLFFAGNLAVPILLWGAHPGGPSVILVSLDTLRADFLGCYGCPLRTSPAIDAFASECVLFENAHSQSPSTLPSHASFLTSLYPSVNKATMLGMRLPKRRVLAMEIVREAGYRTAGIVDATFLTDRYGLEQGYDHFTDWGRRAENIVPRAIRWLRKHGEDPFFLFVHIYDIHSPYARLSEYQEMFLEEEYVGEVRPTGRYLSRYRLMKARGEDPGFEIEEADAMYLRALYAGGIRYTDDLLGPFLEFVRTEGIGDRTVVILTADHGEEFMEHGSVLHGNLYRTVTHVPLLLRLPGAEWAGTRIAIPVGLIDLLPTIVDLTGARAPAPLSGESLCPLIMGETGTFRPFVFSEFEDIGYQMAVLDAEHHLVAHYGEARSELFSYRDDPLELHDLIAEKGRVADSLWYQLSRWRREMAADIGEEFRLRGDAVDPDERLLEELRELGYIE
ncbi:MAG: sulfatase [Candidatus Eisenbacteria bacterium]